MSTPTDSNISTEHQKDGDARKPSDTLDRGETGGQSAEDVKDRPSVGQVIPEDYPDDQRAKLDTPD